MDWNIEECRDEHESNEQWELRRAFIERWKNEYPRDRLLCLARAFTNVEFMGCRYPPEIMQQVTAMSQDVAKSHRQVKKTKLQRTFVSASNAAEDRARGVKRTAGVVEGPQKKISFVAQGHTAEKTDLKKETKTNNAVVDRTEDTDRVTKEDKQNVEDLQKISYDYMDEFQRLPCLELRCFRESMFHTSYGRMVFMVRSWVPKLSNIQSSCVACGGTSRLVFEGGTMTMLVNDKPLATVQAGSKLEAKGIIESLAWDRLRNECIILLVKEQFIAKDSAMINNDRNEEKVASNTDTALATPLDSSVAAKMMKLMGWTGGGLGANEEGISEPIKPHLQQVHRAGLGSSLELASAQHLKRKVDEVMRRYKTDDMLDYDLVFSADFSKEERAELHQVARRNGLISRSYGSGNDRFLVVRKKIDPFALVRAVLRSGGRTAKYQLFIPQALRRQ